MVALRRLADFDPIKMLSGYCPPLVAQILFGFLCFLAEYLIRTMIDTTATGAGPFAPLFPAVLISALYGRWQSGLVTFCLAFLHTWYFVLPEVGSFHFVHETDFGRTMVNGAVGLIILFFAHLFRAAIDRATQERDQEMAAQRLLMRELQHRIKNNFSMVAGLLSIQRRTTQSEEVQEALISASTRVKSFALIHETIYASEGYTADVPLAPYLLPLIGQLEVGLFSDRPVRIVLVCDPASVPRERAVAFGLIVNELVTNAAKHAFPDNRAGLITVSYHGPSGAPWTLSVADNGCGNDASSPYPDHEPSGLGVQLLQAFSVTAGGTLEMSRTATGTTVTLTEAQPGSHVPPTED